LLILYSSLIQDLDQTDRSYTVFGEIEARKAKKLMMQIAWKSVAE